MKKGALMNQGGFTLTEFMMSFSASLVLVYIIFVAIRVISDQSSAASLKMAIETSARDALYRMLMEIRESSPSRITISGGNQIEFQIPHDESPRTSEYAVNWDDTIRYSRGGTGSQIIRTNVSEGGTTILGNDVTSLSFTGNAAQPTVVTVTISVQRTLLNGRVIPAAPIQLTGEARIRNAT